MRIQAHVLQRLSIAAALMGGAFTFIAPVAQASAEVPAIKKLAMLDMQRVLNETVAGKRARKELENSSKAKQTKLDKKRKQLEGDAAKLQGMSGQQLAAAQEKLQRESMELEKLMYASSETLANEHDKLLEKMYKNAKAIVTKMAKAESLDLVLVRDQMTVIYAKDSYDITVAVIKAYNAAHK